jgi:D-alanyl-D-alanine carboxypeptidase (penicillin-binding protein 5/6)
MSRVTVLRATTFSVAACCALLLSTAPALAAPPNGVPLPPDVAVGAGAPPVPGGLQSASWLVADLTSGQVLAARAGSARRAPASTIKILTALTFAPGAPEEIEATAATVRSEGRTAGLKPGVRYRSAELLDAMFVNSANDVAQVLASQTPDPVAAADRMTARARELGATDTVAGSVTGLDAPGQLTTAYDLAVLTRAALTDPAIRAAAGRSTSTLTGSDGARREFSSSNPLLGRYPGALGVKTGSTNQAGLTFVGAAERDGHTLAVVLLQSPSAFAGEATKLLDWGFRATGVASPIADLPAVAPPGAAPTAAAESEPAGLPALTVAEDGGGVSPLLALAVAVTVVAAAFTYWQGREAAARGHAVPGPTRGPARPRAPDNAERRVIRLPDDPEPSAGSPSAGSPSAGSPSAGSPRQSSRESRRIFAP